MPGFYGADVAQLRSLAGVMGKAATTLEMQGMQHSGLVNNTTAWTGSDAQRFKSDWNSSHRLLLLKAATMLKEGAKQLKANADEQDYASQRMGTSAIADLKGVYDTGMGAKALGSTLWNAWKLHKLGFDDWAKSKQLLTNWDDAGRWLKGGLDQLKNGGKLSDVLTDLKAGVPYAQAFEDASKFSQGMRIAGGIAGPLSIAAGVTADQVSRRLAAFADPNGAAAKDTEAISYTRAEFEASGGEFLAETQAVSNLAVFETNAEDLRTLTIYTAPTSVHGLSQDVAAGSLSLVLREVSATALESTLDTVVSGK